MGISVCDTREVDDVLEGSYGDKKIPVRYFPVHENNRVVINIHGLYENDIGRRNKYLKFGQYLQRFGIASSIIYKSSRSEIKHNRSLTTQEIVKKKFGHKTFADELEDARRVLLNTVENSQTIFGVSSDTLEITLNGNSLGGIIAFYLASQFPQVKNISTVGTAFIQRDIAPSIFDTSSKDSEFPILNTLPRGDALSKQIGFFKGKLRMHYGNGDEVFQRVEFDELYRRANAPKFSKIFEDVNHDFCIKNGTLSEEPYQDISSSVSEFVNGLLDNECPSSAVDSKAI